jgi:phosphoribosyl-ATP pyrophosphohydrolase
MRFTVRQEGTGFCHTGTRTCWGEDRGLGRLDRRLIDIARAGDPASNTRKLLDDPTLLAAKLSEEATELAGADTRQDVIHESADLLYFLLVRARAAGVGLGDVVDELDRRERRLTRRPMTAKESAR